MSFNWPKVKKYRFLIILLTLAVITRFFNLNWGSDLTFHPDENNMATAVSSLSWSNLNPHFFAYGQFPLYLAFISIQLLKILNLNLISSNFLLSILVLRFWSALFSLISVILIYKISTQFLSQIQSKILTILFIFMPGLIQLSHFGTTESLLICAFLANIYLAQLYLKSQNTKIILFSGLISGLAISSKITAVFFILPLLISVFIQIFSSKKLPKYIFHTTFYFFLILLIFILTSPFNLINSSDFVSSIRYETSVATGQLSVFYTRQFQNTIPILFQLRHIFPYIAGIPQFIFSLFGIFFVKKNIRHLLIILIPSLIYFIYNSLLFVKWTRFMSPVFFLMPLFASYFISRFKNKKILHTLIVLSILPGILFFTIYLQPDIRLSASDWTSRNLTANSVILSEAGNVINFPFQSPDLHVNNFDFYNLDSDPELINQLPQLISQSDYIIIPSRRIFKNQTNPNFPYSNQYYQTLFNGQLGFQPLKTFSPNYDFLLNAENAEETWSVFDHPTLRIYQNISYLSAQEIHQILSPPNEKN